MPAPLLKPWVDRYRRLTFKEKGRDWDGADCWGLVWLAYRHERGITLPRYDDRYASTSDVAELGRLVEREKAQWREVALEEAAEFDVVVMRMVDRETRQPAEAHVGLVVAPGWMLHIERGIDAALEPYTGLRWRDRVVGIYRYAA